MSISTTIYPVSTAYVTLSGGTVIGPAGATLSMTPEIFGLVTTNVLRTGLPTSVPQPSTYPSYLLVENTASLPFARTLAAGSNLYFTDNGPGSTLVINSTGGGGSGSAPTAVLCTDLSSLRGSTNLQALSVRGYRSYFDNGGGEFYWDSASLTAIDNAIVFGTGSMPGRWKRILTDGRLNVRWFGAQGDGVSDDTAAINAAMSYSQNATNNPDVYFPAGTYMTSGSHKPYFCTKYVGDGRYQTILKFIGTARSAVPSVQSGIFLIDSFRHNITIEDMYLYGNNDTWNGNTANFASSNQLHGIYCKTTSASGYSWFFRNLCFGGFSGRGYHDEGGEVFQSEWNNLDFTMCWLGSLKIGVNSISNRLIGLTLGDVGKDKNELTFGHGAAYIEHLNGIFWNSTSNLGFMRPTGVKMIAVEDDGSGSPLELYVANSNIEDCTGDSIYVPSGVITTMGSVSFVQGLATLERPTLTFRAIRTGQPENDRINTLSADTRFFGTNWGQFALTGSADNVPIAVGNGNGFLSFGGQSRVYNEAYGGIEDSPTMSNVGFTYGRNGIQLNGFRQQYIYNNFTASAGPTTIYVDATPKHFCDATSGSMTMYLMNPVFASGLELNFIKTDSSANAVTIAPSGGGAIDGSGSISLANRNSSVKVLCSGATWYITDRKL